MTKAIEQAVDASSVSAQIAKDSALLGGYAYQIIRQQSKKVFKLRSQVIADTDVENLHDMRIGTRKLRAALLLFHDVIASPPSATAPSDEAPSDEAPSDEAPSDEAAQDIPALAHPVGQLTKALGKVRDFDVMQAWFAEAMEPTQKSISRFDFSKKEKKTIKDLLGKLKKRRKKQFSKMEKMLKSSDYKKLSKRCKQWLKQPTFSPTAQFTAHSNAISRIIPPLTELLQHPGWQIATQKRGQTITPIKALTLSTLNQQLATRSPQLHDLRKQIKQTRYQTEFFRSLYGITYAAQIRELRTLQQVLGKLQDQLIISEFLTAELGHNWSKKLPNIYESFQNSRLELWKEWQPLQAKYLKLGAQLTEETAAQTGT